MIDPTETAAPELAATELLRLVLAELRAIRAAADPPPPERRAPIIPADGTEARVDLPYRSVTLVNDTGAVLFAAPFAGEAADAAAGVSNGAGAVAVAVNAVLTVPLAGRALYLAVAPSAIAADTPTPVYLWHHVRGVWRG